LFIYKFFVVHTTLRDFAILQSQVFSSSSSSSSFIFAFSFFFSFSSFSFLLLLLLLLILLLHLCGVSRGCVEISMQ
jgi:hypothetical protein